MPKLINSVPKLRRHATGQGFVTLNGINHYLGTWGTGKKPSRKVKDAYDARIAEWLAQGRRPTTAAHAVTVGFLCLEFLKDAKKTYGDDPNSRFGKFATLVERLRVYEALAVCEFGPIQLKAIRETMVREGLSITTVNDLPRHMLSCTGRAAELTLGYLKFAFSLALLVASLAGFLCWVKCPNLARLHGVCRAMLS